MLIPYGTDAPIYHWPIATGTIILVNIIAYVVQAIVPMDVWMEYTLSHGEGLHPVQWVTSFFMHAGIFHLLGNMVFLFAFGVVVEGKVGPAMFAGLYMGMGVFQNLTEQLMFLGTFAAPSIGASSAIYALMIIAMFWAPRDHILCVAIVLFAPIFIPIPVLLFSFFYLFVDFGSAMFSGFEMSTPLLHVLGAAVGFIPAIGMLKMNLVDCEQHDLFSLFREMAGKEAKPRVLTPQQKSQEKREKAETEESRKQKEFQFKRSVETHLGAGNVDAAVKLALNYKRRGGVFLWSREQLVRIIQLYQQQENWGRVVEFSMSHIKYHPEASAKIKLNLAKVYLLKKQAPRRAITILVGIDASEFDPKRLNLVNQIRSQAQKEIDDGHIELAD